MPEAGQTQTQKEVERLTGINLSLFEARSLQPMMLTARDTEGTGVTLERTPHGSRGPGTRSAGAGPTLPVSPALSGGAGAQTSRGARGSGTRSRHLWQPGRVWARAILLLRPAEGAQQNPKAGTMQCTQGYGNKGNSTEINGKLNCSTLLSADKQT